MIYIFILDGIASSFKGHCERLGLSYGAALMYRRQHELDAKDAIEIMIAKRKRKSLSPILARLARAGISFSTFSTRLRRGLSVEDAINRPLDKRGQKNKQTKNEVQNEK